MTRADLAELVASGQGPTPGDARPRPPDLVASERRLARRRCSSTAGSSGSGSDPADFIAFREQLGQAVALDRMTHVEHLLELFHGLAAACLAPGF